MRILLTGGGTLGPVTPLLAIAEALPGQIAGFIGTRKGPEGVLVKKAGIPFYTVSAGKLRRYFDLRNLFIPIMVLIGFFKAVFLLLKLKPDAVISGGSFVGVPVLLAAWVLRIPSITHQQDIRPSLANRIIAPFVKKISVVFEEGLGRFGEKAIQTGNPIRKSILEGEAERARREFGLEKGLPTLLVMGGGTGAQAINELVIAALPELTKSCQIIHITGKGKSKKELATRYHSIELLTDKMPDAYAVADLVVARAGVGTITELSAVGKPAIIIPLPDSHQEDNAAMLAGHDAAAIALQKTMTSEKFTSLVQGLLKNPNRKQELSQNIRKINPPNAATRIIDLVIKEVSPPAEV